MFDIIKKSVRPNSTQARQSDNRRFSASSLASESLTRRHRPDYGILIIALLLAVIGLVVVYAISPGLAATKDVGNNYFVIKQTIAILLGIAAFAIFSIIPTNTLRQSKTLLIGIALVTSILVLLLGEEVNGATRWIQIGGLSFQVAEIIKFALIVWLGCFLIERANNSEIEDSRKTLYPLLGIMAAVGLVVAVIQSDLGSTGVMVAIILIMAYTAGLPLKRLALIGGIVLIGTLLAISTSAYRRERVETFLNPSIDCQSSGYQSCQALIAVGSGGMFGLGLGNGVQAYGYLPEAANDSIFAILAEKFGFIGVSVVLGLYIILFSRLKRIIERSKDAFSRLFVTGVLAWISTQAIINIGAMIGLLPLKGITLPFISYGGTSIVFVMAALGIVFNISRFTSFEAIRSSASNNRRKVDEDRPLRRRVGRPYYAANSRRV